MFMLVDTRFVVLSKEEAIDRRLPETTIHFMMSAAEGVSTPTVDSEVV